jgi:NarL family two-component system response regulator LiaR
MTALIRALIVDDHQIVRRGLAALLVPRSGVEVVGEAATGREAVELARDLQPDIILIDLVMPEMGGAEAIALIRRENPDARILVLSSFGESDQVTAAVQAGARGYLLKDSSPDDLLFAIQSIVRGNLVLPEDIARKLLQPQPAAPGLEDFTDREIEVLRLLARGETNQAIAVALHISAPTVRAHVSSILSKLNMTNRTQAALFAQKKGLV